MTRPTFSHFKEFYVVSQNNNNNNNNNNNTDRNQFFIFSWQPSLDKTKSRRLYVLVLHEVMGPFYKAIGQALTNLFYEKNRISKEKLYTSLL